MKVAQSLLPLATSLLPLIPSHRYHRRLGRGHVAVMIVCGSATTMGLGWIS